MANAKESAQEVVKAQPMINPETLRTISSFEDAAILAQETWGDVADASKEIGDGFLMLENKDLLIDKQFIALGWLFTPGDYGTDFLIMRVVTRDPITVNGESVNKFIVTDGGTGLCQQVKEYQTRTERNGGLLVARGLRKSDYENEFGPGTTHYLNV